MFIKIKAQSSGLENQYIKERDIFKKKSKGPKLLLSGFLIAAIGGFFYYLNSGSTLQTNQVSAVNIEADQNTAAAKNSVASVDTDSQNHSQLIADALASDKSDVIETDHDTTDNVSSILQDETTPVLTKSDETLIEASDDLVDKAEDPSFEDLMADVSSNAVKHNAESVVTSTEIDNKNIISAEESTQEKQIDNIVSKNQIASEIENDTFSTSINDVEEITMAEADKTQKKEETIVENIQTTDERQNNIQSISVETALGANDNIETVHHVGEQSKAANIAITDITVESPTNEELSKIATEYEIADIDTSKDLAADEVEPVQNNITVKNVATENDLEDEALIGVVDEKQTSLGITDQSIATIEPISESDSSSTKNKIKESRPIKAISKMIANVFAQSSGDNQEFIADVIEIDFSQVTNPESGRDRVATISVTGLKELDAYQGNSIEEVAQPNYEAIDTDTLDVAKATTIEINETQIKQIIEEEKQLDTPIVANSTLQGVESLFDGVDSVATVSIPDITSLENGHEVPKITTTQNDQSKNIKKEKPSNISDIVEVESVEVEEIAQQKINHQATVNIKVDTLSTVTDPDAELNNTETKSTISIKSLYAQLMTDTDQNNPTLASTNITIANKSNENVTVKKINEQIAKSTQDEQTTVVIEKTKVINELPDEEEISDVKLVIDPDKSLAMVDPSDTNIQINSTEEIVISSFDNIEIAVEDELSDKNEIETASINTKYLTDNKGSTPLMLAALNNDLQTVRELIQQGAQINKRNDWGWTALLNATIKGNHTLVDYLLKNGASPHLSDNDGRSPLMAAVLNNHPKIVKALLNNSADVNKANRDGWTALSFAAWKGNVISVKDLLNANAFKQHRTSEGLTALQLAKQGGHIEVIKLLNL